MIIVGVMSGTSLDGLDLAVVKFDSENDFEVMEAVTVPYSQKWYNKLSNANISGKELAILNNQYGDFIGNAISNLESFSSQQINYIASHGHTFYHHPKKGMTFQIGNGANIYARTNIPTIIDFRAVDIALGGNGAPLVPFGEKYLFKGYNAFLNLGGICNISLHQEDKILGFDVIPFNILLNHYAKQIGKNFDESGNIAKSGWLHLPLLEKLKTFPFLKEDYPKSLDKEQCLSFFKGLIDEFQLETKDILASLVEFYSLEVSKVLEFFKIEKILITGGGAYNEFFIQTLKAKNLKVKIENPQKEIVEFKEAIIFAFLGYKRIKGEINTLSSVTGATKNSVGGCIWG